jgi:ABC-type anion transport system duplicated permease subunit
MNTLVERYGRTGAAAITSAIWFLPMAAWAGSSDLSPIDQTAYPKIALAIGILMLIVWLALLTRIAKAPLSKRTRRLDLAQMSTQEKRWTLALIAFGAGLVAWLNAAATVDWSPLGPALASGKLGPILFAGALAILLVALLAGIMVSWRKATLAYQTRKAEATAYLE